MEQLPENTSHVSPFDAIRQIDGQGNEYWSARDMSKLLGYVKWENFIVVIKRAMKACENSGEAVSDHFPEVRKMIKTGKGAIRNTNDFYLNHTMGKRVRQFIKEGGGTMPEDLPTPEKSIQQVKRDEQKHIGQRQQPSLFDDVIEDE